MRKLLVVAIMIIAGLSVCKAQYNNEWIDFNKTYYKFKVGVTGLYRINQSALPAALQNTPAENFQLWRNGQQVALFTSVINGVLGTNDYIEFWGEKNDGVPDKILYNVSAYQLSDKISLQTDTAAFFLTVNNNPAQNIRCTSVANNVAGNTLQATAYFMYSLRHNFKEFRSFGEARLQSNEYLYASAYDRGEIWASNNITGTQTRNILFNDLNVYASGPNATLKAGIAGNFPANRTVSLIVNNTNVLDTTLNQYTSAIAGRFDNVNLSLLNTGNASIDLRNNSTNGNDKFICSHIELTYPRVFNFGSQSNFAFTLPVKSDGHYLEITNFANGSTVPVLYDITNNVRYDGNIGTVGIIKFAIPSSRTQQPTNYILVSQVSSNVNNITQFTQKVFTDFTQASSQGDYIIISHDGLRTGADYVEQYRAYRASNVGGNYNAKIYDIDELVDQFAFGIKKHPLSIKNFLRYAYNNFSVQPKFALLIGHGVTYNYYDQTTQSETLNAVPTYGYPGSDIMLAAEAYDPIPLMPIGRISVVKPEELNDYFTKLKQYEGAQQSATQTIAAKAWMKNIVHVAGANDVSLADRLENYFNTYKNLVTDTAFGGNVTTFSRGTSGPLTPATNARMKSLWDNGSGLITFFGHSSNSSLDYNLDDPSIYSNNGKYPVFIVNGCSAGNFFANDPARLSLYPTLSEKYNLTKDKGSIGFIASTSLGLEYQLDVYMRGFYNSLVKDTYNKPLGLTIKDAITFLLNTSNSFYYKIHAEQTLLHGDPAMKINASDKPDFVVEQEQIKLSKDYVSVADKSVSVKVYLYNIGKSVGDSIVVKVKRENPSGNKTLLLEKKIKSIRFLDSVSVVVPINPITDKGQNKIIVSIDSVNSFTEISESNNEAELIFEIEADELRPIYPYDLSIINKPASKLVASTANPSEESRQYIMEMDTTALFNSGFKILQSVTTVGGVIEFDPLITYENNKVYYWRVAPAVTSGNPNWRTSSFVYLNQANTLGYNQSHFYQHQQSENVIAQLEDNRNWSYSDTSKFFYLINSVFPISGTQDSHFSIFVNGEQITKSACVGNSIIFNLFDPVTLRPLFNQQVPALIPQGPGGGFMGSVGICNDWRKYNFEFGYLTETDRNKIRDFLDWIGDKYVVTARTIFDNGNTTQQYAPQWALDNGGVNNMYLRLKQAGFLAIDDYTYPRTWMFMYKKNDNSFVPKYVMSEGLNDRIFISAIAHGLRTNGKTTSPAFGPVSSWNKVQWNGTSLENPNTDEYSVNVIGVNNSGNETVLFNLNNSQQDFDISSVSNVQYPYIKLQLITKDTVYYTPYQLNYWRVLGTPLAEAAVAPNIKLEFKDSLNPVETQVIAIPFKNISDIALGTDSISVKMIVYDNNNNATNIAIPRIKKLNPGDTAMLRYELNTAGLLGLNNVVIEFNPDNVLPEQHYFNNIFYRSFYVRQNPVPVYISYNILKVINNKQVDVIWKTLQEVNVKSYIIERSKNGYEFSVVGEVKALNNTNPLTYNFMDKSPFEGLSFYRIKALDKDGSYKYSSVMVANISTDNSVKIVGNPVSNILSVSHYAAKANTFINIYNNAGAFVKSIKVAEANTFTRENISAFSSGHYIAVYEDGNAKISLSFIKK